MVTIGYATLCFVEPPLSVSIQAPTGDPTKYRDSGPRRLRLGIGGCLASAPSSKSLRGQIWGLREAFRPSGPVAASQVKR